MDSGGWPDARGVRSVMLDQRVRSTHVADSEGVNGSFELAPYLSVLADPWLTLGILTFLTFLWT
jgi:hypothetical protein